MSEPESDLEGETITLHELLERSARAALDLQREDGSFPPRRNGVYDERETPVRTTSHWLTTLSKVYEITDDEEFADAANDAADYLLSDEARPHGYTFHSRNAEGKDKCDGLVGQAAPIRGLTRAGTTFNRPELIKLAKKIFSLHYFDTGSELWQRREIDGSVISIDRTLNHQILFAAASVDLAEKRGEVANTLCEHLDGLKKNLRTRSNGLIRHFVRPPLYSIPRSLYENFRNIILLLNEIMFHIHSKQQSSIQTEIGYHPVNLDGLARLKQSFPDHSIWSDSDIQSAIAYLQDEQAVDDMLTEPRGSTIPGIRLARAFDVFYDDKEQARSVLQYTVDKVVTVQNERIDGNKHIGINNQNAFGKMVGLPNYKIRLASNE